MTNTRVLCDDEPFDPREVERLSAVRVGRVPPLKKSDFVWHKGPGGWQQVVVQRRCPGGVYIAWTMAGVNTGTSVVVSCGSFGGLV